MQRRLRSPPNLSFFLCHRDKGFDTVVSYSLDRLAGETWPFGTVARDGSTPCSGTLDEPFKCPGYL